MSIPVAAMIVYIGVMVFTASIISSVISTMQVLMELTSNIDTYHEKVYTRIEIANLSISNDTINLLIKNLGPETVFLVDQGYRWCSLIVSYYSEDGWVTYLLDEYEVAYIVALGSNVSYGAGRSFINPGEGAWLIAKLPDGAPEIAGGLPVTVVFSTRFGEVSKCVVVRND